MVARTPLVAAHRLALGVPLLLLGGAYLGQLGFGLYPCEMCWWQRYPHFAALALALLAFVAPPKRLWLGLAACAILVSGAIGAFHAGVEYGWWEGVTGCAKIEIANAGSAMDAVMKSPLVRCDKAPWTLVGVSLAGWNFLISTVSALAIFVLLGKQTKA